MSAAADQPPRARAWARAVWIAAWGWTLLLLVSLWMPEPPPPEFSLPWSDKLVHLGLFAGFTALWSAHGLPPRWLVPLGIALGGLTELVQGLLPWERHPSWADLGADALGVVIGWGLGLALRRVLPLPSGRSGLASHRGRL